MGADHRYELVKGGDDVVDEPQHTSSPVGIAWWKLLISNLLAACVGAGVMFLIAHGTFTTQPSSGAVAVATPSPTLSPEIIVPSVPIEHDEEKTADSVDDDDDDEEANMLPGQILDCGGNPEEARSKGCVYDVMMQDWVPEPCYDSVLTERYLAEGNWTWYMDGDGQTTISLEEMRKGEHGSAWMATSYHKAHCVFSWVKIVRALRNKRGISQELLSYDHVLHCSHGALRQDSEDQGLGVRAPTNYAKCALYETWKHDFIPDKHNSTSK